jgi:hypothetical protein
MKKIDRQRNKGLIERTYIRRAGKEKWERNRHDMKNVIWKNRKMEKCRTKNIKEWKRRINETVRSY